MKTKQRRSLSYWIKTRFNPQLGTYHVAMGQMTVKQAKAYESPSYGDNIMRRYPNSESYQAKIEELKKSGERGHE